MPKKETRKERAARHSDEAGIGPAFDPRVMYQETDEQMAEKCRRALKVMQGKMVGLNSYARAVTNDPEVHVVIRAGQPMTDGKTIYMRPDLALGEQRVHDPSQCGKRDAYDVLHCEACRGEEEVNITLRHEIGHIVFETFKTIDENDKKDLLRRTLRESGTARAERLGRDIDALVARNNDRGAETTFVNINALISPWLPMLFNCLEDARVNIGMYGARPGLLKQFRAHAMHIFQEGSEREDGSHVAWGDLPINSQILVALLAKAMGYEYEDYFAPEVTEVLKDPEITRYVKQVQNARSARSIYKLGLPILDALKKKGYCRDDNDDDVEMPEMPEPTPEPQDAQEHESGEQVDQSNKSTGESDDSESSEDRSAGKGDADDRDETGETAGEPASEPEDATDDDERADAPVTAGEPEDDGTGDTERDTEGDAAEPDDDEGAGQDDDPMDTEGDTGSDTAAPEEESGTGPGEELGSSDFDGEDEWDDEGCGECGHSEGGHKGWCSQASDEEKQDYDEGQVDDYKPRPDFGDGDEESDDYAQDAEAGESAGGSDEMAGAPAQGTPEEAAEDLNNFGGHKEFSPGIGGVSPDSGSPEVVEMDRAIIQGEFFDMPSSNVFGVQVHEPFQGPGYDRFSRFKDEDLFDLDVPESVLAPALREMRITFSNNKRVGHARNLKSGGVNAKVLGRRVPVRDERLFQKKRLPARKSYFVVLGGDMSGSTGHSRRGMDGMPEFVDQRIKMAMFAQANLLDRAGIPFAMYCHTGSYEVMGGGSGVQVDIHPIKTPEQRWNADAILRLQRVGAAQANLDGHTLEFYRKIAERQRATDKVIMYYTDGAMPAENYDEELVILEREIKMCLRKEITLVGVGVGTDAPTEHGLDTIRLDEIADVPNVVKGLKERLT